MRFSLRNGIALGACLSLFVICSCEKHEVGELPEVQKERGPGKHEAAAAASEDMSPTPAAKPTPAEFFPTKP